MRCKGFNSNILNNKGEISFIGVSLVLMSIALWSILLIKNVTALKRLKIRTEKHLCFKYLYTQTNKYHNRIAHLNKTIKISFLLLLIPASRVQAKSAMKMAQSAQTLLSVSYLKNLLTYQSCSKTDSYKFIMNIPYQRISPRGFSFKRNFDGTTILKSQSWTFIHYLYPTNFLEEKIELSFKAKSSLQAPMSSINYITSLDSKLYKRHYGRHLFSAY
jgi:hypothetical protein